MQTAARWLRPILFLGFGFLVATGLPTWLLYSTTEPHGFHQVLDLSNTSPQTEGVCPAFETSGSLESIMPDSGQGGWLVRAGGEAADTHYARIRYKVPECASLAPSRFYARIVFTLPEDFYTQMQAGFRLMNTDNFATTLNGQPVGALDDNELRCSWNIYNSDKLLRFQCERESGEQQVYYLSEAPLPTGQHSLEMYGNLARKEPWYLTVDGVTVASGYSLFATADTQASERVVTRFVAGIDGAAQQSEQSMQYLVTSFEIADYDVNRRFLPTLAWGLHH